MVARCCGPQGFTLVELMAIIAIAGILTIVAVPALKQYVAAQRIKAAAYDLEASLRFARSEAVKRNTTVSVRPLAGSWQDGWSVEVAGLALKLVSGSKSLGGLAVTGPAAGISYGGDGRTTLAAAQEIQIRSSANPDLPMRCVVLALTGQPLLKVDRDQDGDCADE